MMQQTKSRVYNFGAGPATLPESILKQAQDELLNWQHLGMSVLEVGHRTPEFTHLLHHAEQSLRDLIQIPINYKVLFLGGPARMQFAMIPLNLLGKNDEAGYLETGVWSQMALAEAKLLKKAYRVASGAETNFTSVPDASSWNIKKSAKYIYYTPNETVNGLRIPFVPKTSGIPIIADMTSCLLSEPIDVNQFGLIFAGAQKNIANAGLTIVIIREDLLEQASIDPIPTMLNYKFQAHHHSLYATSPVFNCYLADKMFDWIKAQGGVEALYKQNCLKAAKLYQYLDNSDFYRGTVAKEDRSIINICFTLNNKSLEDQFIATATQNGLAALKGHRFVGGLRASLYNAMPMAGVNALIDFMTHFAQEHS